MRTVHPGVEFLLEEEDRVPLLPAHTVLSFPVARVGVGLDKKR